MISCFLLSLPIVLFSADESEQSKPLSPAESMKKMKLLDGLEIDAGTKDYVRHTVYSWYNDSDQLEASADYGAGSGTSSTTTWKRERSCRRVPRPASSCWGAHAARSR